MVQSWTDLPIGRPIRIEGASAETLALSIDPLPADAPAIIAYTPEAAERSFEVVHAILSALDSVALDLFPIWLPGAEAIDSAVGAGAAAVRSIALRAAGDTGGFGPFLADLAERGLRQRGHRSVSPNPFTPEVRAHGLARVIATSVGRQRTALLVRVPDGIDAEDQQALAAGCRWLAEWGGFGIWFTGCPLRGVDWLEHVVFRPPSPELALTPEPDETVRAGVTSYPAVAGKPHPASQAEQLLEASLESCDWAAGRAWNQDYQAHPLINPVRLDLLWREERCVVEIDGPEHREPLRFAADRQRDVLLQLAGYAVLRFTNAQVLTHRQHVLAQIKRFLEGRRAASPEGVFDGRDQVVRTGAGDSADPHGGEHRALQLRDWRAVRRFAEADREEPGEAG